MVDAMDINADVIEAMADVFQADGEEAQDIAHCEDLALRKSSYTRGSTDASFKVDTDGSACLAVRDTLPPVAWSNVLANRDFGFLATETGTGFMWYGNSREMKVNRWLCDPMTAAGTEEMRLMVDGEDISLFASGDGYPSLVRYGFGYAVWERQIGRVRTRLTSFVPNDMAARVMMLEIKGEVDGLRLRYYTDLVMGGSNRLCRSAKVWRENGAVCARNLMGEYSKSVFKVVSSQTIEEMCSSKEQALKESTKQPTNPSRSHCFMGITPGKIFIQTLQWLD